MRSIYASVNIGIKGVNVKNVSELPPLKREWVAETMIRLKGNPTYPERLASKILSQFDDKPIRQAFFMIRKRCYFLDFFFPERMLAIEIDGSSHDGKKEHDRRRDADFRSIGIRTIRIKNKDVTNGRLIDVLNKKIFKKINAK